MRSIFTLILSFFSLALFSQTVLFSENFDSTPIAMTASSSGTSTSWSVTTTFQTSGTSSDSASVQAGDTLFLESTAFNTMGFTFVTLSFDQICKVDFFDEGIIEYSINNGASWTKLTSSEYLGNGFMSNDGFSAISYSTWNVGNVNATPTQSWWQSETFDLSAASNNMQVKVRFALIDKDNNGARGNYGWLLDEVEVIGAPCELIPPTIMQVGTIYQGQVYGSGPYLIEADIQDASGIASAVLEYTVNGGSVNSLTMTISSGTTYQATIPSASVGDVICYTIKATDNTTCSNQAQQPTTGCTQFTVNPNAPPNCIGNPISNYNYSETFASFTPGNGRNPGGVGMLNNDWTNSTADTHDWWVYDQSTMSNNTGPTSDHSPGDANFMYVEASNGFTNETAILNTPCYDLSGLTSPKFSFWYYMLGNSLGELHVDIYDGNSWFLDVTPAIIGNQGAQWLFREIDLTSYAGTIVQLRFRGLTGNTFSSDIAIDDIEIIEPIADDLFLSEFITPSPSSCGGSTNEIVTVRVENLGSVNQDTIPLAYRVNSGIVQRDTAFFSLAPTTGFNHTFQQTFDMSIPGSYTLDAWIELPNDGDRFNDSITGYTASTSAILAVFPDTVDFENFTVGTPGTFARGWRNDPTNLFNWFVNSGNTPSNQTGPSGDTTTRAGTGNYLYYEATNVPQAEQGSVISNCLDISNMNRPELKFYYHMSGIEMGDLQLDLNLNGFLIQNIIPVISGDQGGSWVERVVDLTPFKGEINIIFRATRGTGYRSDIAIDQISIRDARPTSIQDVQVSSELFSIYPNPVSSELFINTRAGVEIVITNAIGAEVLRLQPATDKQVINTSDWSNGLYFVSVIDNETIETRKLIKK